MARKRRWKWITGTGSTPHVARARIRPLEIQKREGSQMLPPLLKPVRGHGP